MNAVDNNYFYNWFTPEFLKQEFVRLFEIFAPLYSSFLPDVEIRVVEEGPPGVAAKAFFEDGVIEVYSGYHSLYSGEYKVTLLHEAAHFVFSRDHSGFEDFYKYLKFRQSFIEEQVVPDTYEEFLYCKRKRVEGYTFMCSGCREKRVESSFNTAHCGSCDRRMLLISGL